MHGFIKYTVALTSIALFGLLSAGCSEKSPRKAVSPTPAISDLGTVTLTNGVQSSHDLGDNRTCIITPTVLADGSVNLKMVIEESGHKIAAPMVTTLPGRAVQISVGPIGISLTPKISE